MRLRLREDAALSALPQAADVTILTASSGREDSRQGELACELQYCLGLFSLSTQVIEDQGWRTGERRRQKADARQHRAGKEDPLASDCLWVATRWLEMCFCPAEQQWCFQTLTLFWNDV